MTQAVFDLIVALRGGVPEKCDFCERLYTEVRYPIPEEAGMWACNECWDRWAESDPAYAKLTGKSA